VAAMVLERMRGDVETVMGPLAGVVRCGQLIPLVGC